MTTPTHVLQLRSGNWGWQGVALSSHSTVSLQLAPVDAPGVLVRFVEGLPPVPRELGAEEILELSLNDGSGAPRLLARPPQGSVERLEAPAPAEWELRIEATEQRAIYLYARRGTPFPSDEELDALAACVR